MTRPCTMIVHDCYNDKSCKLNQPDCRTIKCAECCHQVDYRPDGLADYLFKLNDAYYDPNFNMTPNISPNKQPDKPPNRSANKSTNKSSNKPTNKSTSKSTSRSVSLSSTKSNGVKKSKELKQEDVKKSFKNFQEFKDAVSDATNYQNLVNPVDAFQEGCKELIKHDDLVNYQGPIGYKDGFKDALKTDDSKSNNPQLDLARCYTCEKSKFQTIQTYESIKYVLMTVILVSIIDGLFTLNYQKLLIQQLQIILLKHKNPLLFCEYNKLFLFNDDKLRIATGLLYLINVSIQFIGFVGISNDSLILTSSYAIYSIICFVFTVGTYLNYRRLFISLCINCLLAILSIIFSIMIKIVKPIKKRNMFVV